MYITSFIHREELLHIAERWLCGRPLPSDAMQLTRIFICDGYVLGETLETVTEKIVGKYCSDECRKVRIRFKGELRDALCKCNGPISPRMEYLFERYRNNREYFYYQTPINGVLCVDDGGRTTTSKSSSSAPKLRTSFSHGVGPAREQFLSRACIHRRRKAALSSPLFGELVRIVPISDVQTGTIRGAECGGLGNARPHDVHAQHVGLKLHQQIVDRGTAVDAQFA